MRCFILVALFVLPYPINSFAYNATGHKVVASICFRQLTAEQRDSLLEVLKQHPRFEEDFESKMPPSIAQGDETEQAEWLFQQAAIWPDMVKSGPPERRAFNRARWHFVNMPHFLSEADREALEDHVDVNLAEEPNEENSDDPAMNVVQAINNSRAILHSGSTSDAVKAVHICWLLHLISDLEQPLHSTALFSQHLFPQGDKGGNGIKTQPLSNLHAAWDASFGTSDSFANCRNIAVQLLAREGASDLLLLGQSSTDPATWRDEAFEVAIEHVYNHEVVLQLTDLEEDEDDIDHNPITLSPSYLQNRRVVAERLAVIGGVRCAGALVGESVLEATPVIASAATAEPTDARLQRLERKVDRLPN